jgi:hypothetical protein
VLSNAYTLLEGLYTIALHCLQNVVCKKEVSSNKHCTEKHYQELTRIKREKKICNEHFLQHQVQNKGLLKVEPET